MDQQLAEKAKKKRQAVQKERLEELERQLVELDIEIVRRNAAVAQRLEENSVKEDELATLHRRNEELTERCQAAEALLGQRRFTLAELEHANSEAAKLEHRLLSMNEGRPERIRELERSLGASVAKAEAHHLAAERVKGEIAEWIELEKMATRQLTDLKAKTEKAELELAEEQERLGKLMHSLAEIRPMIGVLGAAKPGGTGPAALPWTEPAEDEAKVGKAPEAKPYRLRGTIESSQGAPSWEPFAVYSARSGRPVGTGLPDAEGRVDMPTDEMDLYIVLQSQPNQRYRVRAHPLR